MPHTAEISALTLDKVLNAYFGDDRVLSLSEKLSQKRKIQVKGLSGSSQAFVIYATAIKRTGVHFILADDKEAAAYLYNDLETLNAGPQRVQATLLFFPSSWKKPYDITQPDTSSVQQRAETLSKLQHNGNFIVVTTPDALSEKVLTSDALDKNSVTLHKGEKVSMSFLTELFYEFGFARADYVTEPGTFSVRGGIVDVFSFSSEEPYRIQFSGDEVESIRSFDPSTQLTDKSIEEAAILSNITDKVKDHESALLCELIKSKHPDQFYWITTIDSIQTAVKDPLGTLPADVQIKYDPENLKKEMQQKGNILFQSSAEAEERISFSTKPQPDFNKNFNLFFSNISELRNEQFETLMCFDSTKQSERLHAIYESLFPNLKTRAPYGEYVRNDEQLTSGIHEGFIDQDLKIAVYTDHQLFGRYHKYRLKYNRYKKSEAITIKMLKSLQPGDYVTHIDHGIGRFGGLEKIELPSLGGEPKYQESIRLVYKDNDTLYISIHSLHQISKFSGKEAEAPKLDKLGSGAWASLKNRTKKKIKELAFDLVKLYAERKEQEGFAFQPDTYLQNELEASFIYEDTPDQLKATQDVKKDMEENHPMDRLICGDVGFGKTEIAVRAAFKAATDGKQTAILVPTTILALQHYKTFTERLKGLPCTVDYINRFKSVKEQKETLKKAAEGKLDILIGTHRLLGKDLKFKDLGLLIVDEEQKFGVGAKDKLKLLKSNVDTLTLTATPIPRTLQFSMMGARDMSVINTPPPNRYPVLTEVHVYNEKVIRDAIEFELQRGGQIFFIHNRVQNINKYAEVIQKLFPKARILVAHGQMKGEKLEKAMLGFIDGDYDILVCTTIVESGLDIPNANTIIINDAQNYGLSDLHQLRGRVGRSNKKAFCYLLTPPFTTLTNEARKRLRAIEEFTELGSGIHVAMRDLDIRGAGNLLGAEQSGFISDIGYEMYQKILDEALDEIKRGLTTAQSEGEGPQVVPSSPPLASADRSGEARPGESEGAWSSDCTIDSDLSLLIPENYVESITERIALYQELDNCKDEEELQKFLSHLTDRFGPAPDQTLKLMDVVRLRWKAMQLGIEKLVLKNNRLIAWFITDKESPFYQSKKFNAVLQYAQNNQEDCLIEENRGKLTLKIDDIASIEKAVSVLNSIG